MSLLLIDVGNSSINLGIKDGNAHLKTWCGSYDDAYTIISKWSVQCRLALISSVVPTCHDKLNAVLQCPSQFLMPNAVPGLSLKLTAPEQVGVDRLVCALGAITDYEGDCLIVDSGTALTFCVVDQSGGYHGGSIFPGMKIASQALNDYTAKVPLVMVAPQETVVSGDTDSAVRSGLYFGYSSLIMGMVEEYKAQWPNPLTVIGTGGGLEVLLPRLSLDHHDPDLIFKGLMACAKRLNL